jgi:hypothetical protein
MDITRLVHAMLLQSLSATILMLYTTIKVKQSHNTLVEAQGREKIEPLLIHDLGTRWG